MARALCFALVLALAPPALGQSMRTDAQPAGGVLSPGDGTLDASVEVRATTEVPVDNCYGYVDPSAPDLVVDWDGGDFEVSVQGDFDPTLAVYTASGQWVCDDDTDRLLPVIALNDAPAGRYAVWVGSFNPGAGETARVTAGARPPQPTLNAAAVALAGTIQAAQGFEAQGAIEVAVRAGGTDSAQRIDLEGRLALEDNCTGFYDARQPTATVAYDGTGELGLTATAADADLVMMVLTPDGTVRCNDDFESTDPALGFAPAAAGDYAVWVGTYRAEDDTVPATLVVSETAPAYDDFEDVIGDGEIFDEMGGYGAYSEGSYVALDLDATPASRVRASQSEGGSAEVSFRPQALNPVNGPSCVGHVELAPTAAIELSGDGPFALTASSDDDLTLTVRTPGGGWFCSDDADGLDPGIQIDAPEDGTYLAWVGTFGEREDAVTATLAATPGELAVTDPRFGSGYDGPTQSDGAYDGAELDGEPLATATFSSSYVEREVEAGGPVLNPVEGEVCGGFVDARPTLAVEADGPFEIVARGDEDLTLIVRDPSGAWTCGDDADGTNPRVSLSGQGTFSVWVGTYYRRTAPVPATVEVSADVIETIELDLAEPPDTIRG